MGITGAINLLVLLPMTVDIIKKRRGQGMSRKETSIYQPILMN